MFFQHPPARFNPDIPLPALSPTFQPALSPTFQPLRGRPIGVLPPPLRIVRSPSPPYSPRYPLVPFGQPMLAPPVLAPMLESPRAFLRPPVVPPPLYPAVQVPISAPMTVFPQPVPLMQMAPPSPTFFPPQSYFPPAPMSAPTAAPYPAPLFSAPLPPAPRPPAFPAPMAAPFPPLPAPSPSPYPFALPPPLAFPSFPGFPGFPPCPPDTLPPADPCVPEKVKLMPDDAESHVAPSHVPCEPQVIQVPVPVEVEVIREVEVAPIVQQNITLYQPRPEPTLTVCQYPREFYYCEVAKAKVEQRAEQRMMQQTVKTITVRVSTGDDDCEQKLSTGKTSLHDDDLDLREGRLVGIRFKNLNLRPRQIIRSATIQFRSKLDKSDNCQVDIHADASGDSAPFNHELGCLSGRPKTRATVHWSLSPWTPGSTHATPDLSPILQEIVNQPGWRAGNALTLILHGSSGHRSAWAFDGNPSMAPELTIKAVEEEAREVGSSSELRRSGSETSISGMGGSPMRPGSFAGPGGLQRQDSFGSLRGTGPNHGPPPQHGPIRRPGMQPNDVVDGFDPYGHARTLAPQNDPWNLPGHSHPAQAHGAAPIHPQTAHLVYEDKFRYLRYNLSHECLRPTKLERQIPESARPLLERQGAANQQRFPTPPHQHSPSRFMDHSGAGGFGFLPQQSMQRSFSPQHFGQQPGFGAPSPVPGNFTPDPFGPPAGHFGPPSFAQFGMPQGPISPPPTAM